MLRLKRLLAISATNLYARNCIKEENKLYPVLPFQNPSQWSSCRFLDIYQIGNKEAIEKERARLKDEMNRGYFADMAEMKQHGGKIAMANKIIIPASAAAKFPMLEVNYSDGSCLKLPITSAGNDADTLKLNVPKATLLCLSFRASSQPMVDSWSSSFLDTFGHSGDARLYEMIKGNLAINLVFYRTNKLLHTIIDCFRPCDTMPGIKIIGSNISARQKLTISFIDSWLLTLNPIKKLLLKIMRKPKPGETKDTLRRQIVYSLGDNYYFRKELRILNLLTGYVFLLDKMGRIRWQGFGSAKQEELLSLLSCTSLLLDEK